LYEFSSKTLFVVVRNVALAVAYKLVSAQPAKKEL